MKNITKESLKDDLMIISEMFNKYSEAIYEGQCNQQAHYDNQPKLIKLVMEDVRCGLAIVKNALQMLNETSDILIED